MSRRSLLLIRRRGLGLIAVLALLLPHAGFAWSPESQTLIGRQAARLAPSDFARLLDLHKRELLRGLQAPYGDRDSALHDGDPDGGQLATAIARSTRDVIDGIRDHRPFSEIAYLAGVALHYMNDANNPLNCSNDDPNEGAYYADFLDYLESTEPRIAMIFYGLEPTLERGDLAGFVAGALERCRGRYPSVAAEYRRTGRMPGARYFDDRSTAFGLSAVAHSRALTDSALLLRYIWIAAGGADWRSPPSSGEGRLFVVPRERP